MQQSAQTGHKGVEQHASVSQGPGPTRVDSGSGAGVDVSMDTDDSHQERVAQRWGDLGLGHTRAGGKGQGGEQMWREQQLWVLFNSQVGPKPILLLRVV